MMDHQTRTVIPSESLFVIACPSCLGHVAAIARMAGEPACCPLCAAPFLVPPPRLAAMVKPSPFAGRPAAKPAPAAPAPIETAVLPVTAVEPAPVASTPLESAPPEPAPVGATPVEAPSAVAVPVEETRITTAPEAVAPVPEAAIAMPASTAAPAPEPSEELPVVVSLPMVTEVPEIRDTGLPTAMAADVEVAIATDDIAPLAVEAIGEASLPQEPAAAPLAVAPTELAFKEPVKVVGRGEAAIELRRLTEEERRIRRGRRNIILLLVGAAVLIMLVVAFGMPARRR